MYVNTLTSRIGDALLLQYADNITLVCSGLDPAESTAHNWLVEHQMRLNVQKSCHSYVILCSEV